ncbi:adenylate cyclase [Aliikangiella marina]|uniref:Adenylate cyclase n=1 Tax=Aliikangiella marina TaxID=1712262 RepID=A0A545T2J7_9GAMM|nr:adenylate/guanylate cyclase domain-containing protein [Aliikangiella marina]TQV71443.1 adenylate cyclase [Aliikangiella marina]
MQLLNQDKLIDELITLFESQLSAPNFRSQSTRTKILETIQKNLIADISAETKNVSILLSDLRGFTAMSEKYSPLLVIELLNRYFSRMSEIIDKYDGVIDKFMGDSIMVLFGAIKSSSDDLTNAIACAIEMQMAMSEINHISQSLGMENLYMGIGVNTGEVVAGTLGSDIYREYTVIGDQVNLASRVEAHSLRGQILLTENSYQLAKDKIEVGEVNKVYVKGKTEPVTMYELKRIKHPKDLTVPLREIRKSPRVAANIPITFQKIDQKKILTETFQGIAVDISYGGLYATLDYSIAQFSEIKMKVSLSIIGSENSDIYARVLKCEKIDEQYHAHFEFTAIDEKAKKALKAYVDQMI